MTTLSWLLGWKEVLRVHGTPSGTETPWKLHVGSRGRKRGPASSPLDRATVAEAIFSEMFWQYARMLW
eukprot:6857825-Prorocentrum_lima.AAC.1